jgi:hypothetical protein
MDSVIFYKSQAWTDLAPQRLGTAQREKAQKADTAYVVELPK